jgi:hypothetical protein
MNQLLGTVNAKPNSAHEGNYRRRVHRLETQNDVTPTCHPRGVLPALRKQPAEKCPVTSSQLDRTGSGVKGGQGEGAREFRGKGMGREKESTFPCPASVVAVDNRCWRWSRRG